MTIAFSQQIKEISFYFQTDNCFYLIIQVLDRLNLKLKLLCHLQEASIACRSVMEKKKYQSECRY